MGRREVVGGGVIMVVVGVEAAARDDVDFKIRGNLRLLGVCMVSDKLKKSV